MADADAVDDGQARVNPNRRAVEPQSQPVERAESKSSTRWSCSTIVEEARTGKASGWTRETTRFQGRTCDEVLSKRNEYLGKFLRAPQECAANFYWVSRQSKEGSGIFVDWSFFESCHGKCLCYPEGGTLKNAGKNEETQSQMHVMKTVFEFYQWASQQSGLRTPSRSLEEKDGRGIFRRFFYWIPAKGVGAVDRARLPKFTAEGSSKLHEFVDIGVPGTVSTRRASCHTCDECWAGHRDKCVNITYTEPPTELKILREHEPSTSLSRVTRSQLDQACLFRAAEVSSGGVVCVETHNDEQTYPWVLCKVLRAVRDAEADTPPFNRQTDAIHLPAVNQGDKALQVQLYEPIEPGSSAYTLSDVVATIPAPRVRVIDVELKQLLPQRRTAAANVHVSATSRTRFHLDPDSLLKIRAEMPSTDDEWEVEAVRQYRTYYRHEQWLVKWNGYGEDRNTWEPRENLLGGDVIAMAERVKKDYVEAKDAAARLRTRLGSGLARADTREWGDASTGQTRAG